MTICRSWLWMSTHSRMRRNDRKHSRQPRRSLFQESRRFDVAVLDLNRRARQRMRCESRHLRLGVNQRSLRPQTNEFNSLNRRTQRERSGGPFSVVSVSSCSKYAQEDNNLQSSRTIP